MWHMLCSCVCSIWTRACHESIWMGRLIKRRCKNVWLDLLMYELKYNNGVSGSASNCNSCGQLTSVASYPQLISPLYVSGPSGHAYLLFFYRNVVWYSDTATAAADFKFARSASAIFSISSVLTCKFRNHTKLHEVQLSNAVRYVRLDHNGTQVSCTDSPLLFGVVASHRAVIKPSWSRSLGPAFAHETPVICCKPTTMCFTLNHGWNLFLHHVKQAGLPAFYNVCFCYVSSCYVWLQASLFSELVK